MTITLRPAVPQDRSFVFDTYNKSHGHVVGAPKFDHFYCRNDTQIILVDDTKAGFISLIREGDTTDIQCLFLQPAFQNRGIGTYLLQGIMAHAVAEGTRLTIATEKTNPAKRLYERLGFVFVRETKYRFEYEYPNGKKGSA